MAARGGRHQHGRTSRATRTKAGNAPAVLATAAHTVTATYHYHYNRFMPIGPHCAVADVTPGGQSAIVYVQAQSVSTAAAFQPIIGAVLNPTSPTSTSMPPPQNIRVVWYEGSASYGGGQTGEVAEEAAADLGEDRQAGAGAVDALGPARLGPLGHGATCTTSRWAPTPTATCSPRSGTPTASRRRASTRTKRLLGNVTWPATAAAGGIAPSDTAIYNNGGLHGGGGVPTPAVTAGAREDPAALRRLDQGQLPARPDRTADVLRERADRRRARPRQQHGPGRVPGPEHRRTSASAATGPGAAGSRCSTPRPSRPAGTGSRDLPELGHADRRHPQRAAASASAPSPARQVGIVADVQVNMKTGKISSSTSTIAQDNGITINPQHVGNQMSGSAIMGVSRAHVGEPQLEQPSGSRPSTGSPTRSCASPTARRSHSSTLHPGQYTVVIPGDMTGPERHVSVGNTNAFNQGWLATGSGEPPCQPAGSSIANAFFNATGARIRYTPMTPATARGALKAAGSPNPPRHNAATRGPSGAPSSFRRGKAGTMSPMRACRRQLLGAALALGLGLALSGPGGADTLPTLYVNYAQNCTSRSPRTPGTPSPRSRRAPTRSRCRRREIRRGRPQRDHRHDRLPRLRPVPADRAGVLDPDDSRRR